MKIKKRDLLESIWVRVRMGETITDADTGRKIQVTKRQVDTLMSAVVEGIAQALECGEDVAIPGLGIFFVKQYPRGSRIRDVRTGEMRPRRADRMRTVRFKPALRLKERVNATEEAVLA